jgi:ABC-type glycerol-3-phosphate transport system substrate-binding protein
VNGPRRLVVGALASALLMAGCLSGTSGSSGGASGDGEGSREPVTITVWDYYGQATPIKPAIAGFEKKYPWITVKYEAIDWDTAHEKFTVVVSGGNPPDVATMDMTWMPTFASNGLFADLGELSGGKVNGRPIEDTYTSGGLEAMRFDDKYVTMLFDFDAYALYYRADLFKKKGIPVPKTWDQLLQAAGKLAEDTDGDGKKDKYLYEISGADCFHWCQFLFQAGGSLLNADGTQAAFDGPAGVQALEMYKRLQESGNAVYWTDAEGDPMNGIKDERIGMFQDGPYWMGLLKDGAPELKGKWRVAPSPRAEEPGSYLGGTGLSVPVNAKHPEAAWLFIDYMLGLPRQIGVFKRAGAAPATNAALESPVLTKPDPYFDGEAPFPVFLDSMSQATHFPYVEHWDQIDVIITNMVDAVMLDKKTPQEALDDAARSVNEELSG